MGTNGEDSRPRGHVPLHVAAWLVQAGTFVMALGAGAVLASFRYGPRTLSVGFAMLFLGYASINLPRWYVDRLPRLREGVVRNLRRLYRTVS